jgi:hypothetical protein
VDSTKAGCPRVFHGGTSTRPAIRPEVTLGESAAGTSATSYSRCSQWSGQSAATGLVEGADSPHGPDRHRQTARQGARLRDRPCRGRVQRPGCERPECEKDEHCGPAEGVEHDRFLLVERESGSSGLFEFEESRHKQMQTSAFPKCEQNAGPPSAPFPGRHSWTK